MDDYARRNLKDFLSMYNQFTELCFNHCIQNFNYRHMIPEEIACANRCAEKLINVNHRLIATYMEVNPLHKQAAALEAAQSAGESSSSDAAARSPLNLAGQVQEVFGPNTVVTDGSSGVDPIKPEQANSSVQVTNGQSSVTQKADLPQVVTPTADSESKLGAAS